MGRSLRIALLSYRSKPHSGGQGIYVRALSRELTELGHRVEVLSGQPYPELEPGVPLTRVPSLDLYREPDPFRTPRPAEFRDWVDVAEWATMCTAGFPEPLTFSLRAARLLSRRTADFDLVHDNQSLGYGLLRIARAGLPTVATVHHPVAIDRQLELAAAGSWRRRLTLRRWYAFTRMQATVVGRLDAVTTVSENSRRDIERYMGRAADRVDVIPVGIDADVFAPPSPGARRDADSIVVVTSADVPLKGLVHLLEAVAKLRTERAVRLTVVGTARPGGPTEEAVERLGIADAVRFTGPVPEAELVALLHAAAVVAVPSLYEGFSLPAVEAMACGAPLVTTDAGALPEVVGDAGLRVRAGDVGELTAALRQVLDSPELGTRLGLAGRQRVLERYTWRTTAQRTAEWYGELLERRGRSC
jgi:glycosyltransferase involved in cell wall biosynthesis